MHLSDWNCHQHVKPHREVLGVLHDPLKKHGFIPVKGSNIYIYIIFFSKNPNIAMELLAFFVCGESIGGWGSFPVKLWLDCPFFFVVFCKGRTLESVFLKWGLYVNLGIPTTIKTMGVNITTIVYLRVLIIQIGSAIILMVVEAQGESTKDL